jgi:pseudaminic acid biosynthesis-associated methylase
VEKLPVSRQVEAWRGQFGEAYIRRNPVTAETIRRKIADWSKILGALANGPPASFLEVGANVGQNIAALRQLTSGEIYAVEPNPIARLQLVKGGLLDETHVRDGSAAALPFDDASIDLVFTSGVLIHIDPADLFASCREMHRVARRNLLSIEYFSDQPMERPYQGQDQMLFLRDYGAFWLENFADLRIVDFGFFWKPVSGDSLNWWLFEKTTGERPSANP